MSAPASKPKLWPRWRQFIAALWHDHDFWIRAYAIKGGASAALIAGVTGISFMLSLPFMIAASGIVICFALIGLGLYGVLYSSAAAIDSLREIYYKTILHQAVPVEKTPTLAKFRLKITTHPLYTKFIHTKLIEKIKATTAWQAAGKLAKRQEDFFVTNLAMGGSILSAIIGLTIVLTQAVVFSVVAIPLTLIAGLVGLGSGIYGIYLTAQKMISKKEDKK